LGRWDRKEDGGSASPAVRYRQQQQQASMAFSPQGTGAYNAPLYHRPISAAVNRTAGVQSHAMLQPQSQAQQAAHWHAPPSGVGIAPVYKHPQSSASLSHTQPVAYQGQRVASAGNARSSQQSPITFSAQQAPSARASLSRTQPLIATRNGLVPGTTVSASAAFNALRAQQQALQQQLQYHPEPVSWQQFRGGGGAPASIHGLAAAQHQSRSARPHSSAAVQRGGAHGQEYNIITGGPLKHGHNGRAVWEAGMEQPSGRTLDADAIITGRTSHRNSHASAAVRSHSVDRNYANMRASRAQQDLQLAIEKAQQQQLQRAQQQQQQRQPSPHHSPPPFQPPPHRAASPSPAAASAAAAAAAIANGSPHPQSPAYSPSSPHFTQQLQHQQRLSSQLDNSVRFSANALGLQSPDMSPPRGSPSSASSSSLSRTQPLQFSPSATARLDSSLSSSLNASTSSDTSSDGAVLEVGVAEDPNPRFRPTMEDAHVVRMGDTWVEDDAATARESPGGMASPGKFGATARKSPALDWGSPARKPAGAQGSQSGNVKSGYFAVYDGHGGREAVEFIERNLHRQVARKLRDGAHPLHALESAFLDTDSAMQATRRYQECGSTVASALIRPSASRAGQRDLFIANVGDARAVVAVKSGASAAGGSPGRGAPLQAVRLSRDHTPNDPSEAERVRRAGGAVFRGRVDGQLAVSRAMGDHSLRRSGVSAVPHQQHLPLTHDHKFMIVACDGLWDVMTDAEAVNLIAGMTDANKMADKLVKTAMQRGTTDNVSAMVVRLHK